jgi:antitoxin PrlF
MSSLAIRVQEKGQVTIPLKIRKKLGLKKGDFVTFVETGDGVVIKPAEVIALQALDEINRALTEKGVTLDELIAQAHIARSKAHKARTAHAKRAA